MTHSAHRFETRQAAKAAVISRAQTDNAALSVLILSVLLGLLSGAAWTLVT